ncbi:MAG: rod shape-determining protein MreD [Firmicutes bacterium]|nr:rod shape-determining protein MreD [Bacillota bacterium]
MIRFVVPYLLYSAAALICIFLQQEVFVHLQIFNVRPDLLLLLVVMSALKSDWKNGVAVGLLLGFWIDLVNAAYFGTNMVVYGLVGASFGLLGTKFPHRTYEGYFFSAVAGSLMSGILMLMLLSLLDSPIVPWQSFIGIVLPMTFYTSLIAFFGLPLIWFHRQNNRRKIGRIDLIGNGVVFVKGNEPIDLKKLAARRKARHFGKSPRQKHDKKRSAEDKERRSSASDSRKRRETSRRPQDTTKGNRRKPTDHKPKSYPQRRPNKHQGRRSK